MELVALVKFFTALTAAAALMPTAAISVADGLDGSALTALCSVSTEVLMAVVSVGKSLFALSTSFVASVWMVVACV